MFSEVQKNSAIGFFFLHLLTATFGTALITGLLAFLLEHVISRDAVSLLALGPFFVVPILSGFVLGYFIKRVFSGRGAGWVWVVPGLFLIINIAGSLSSPYERKDVWLNEFGPHVRCTACLDEPFITAPLVGSIGYAMGARFRSRRSRTFLDTRPEP